MAQRKMKDATTAHRPDPFALFSDWYAEFEALKQSCKGKQVPRPADWGGYRLLPDSFEFWTQRQNRLHERLACRLAANGRWRVRRLQP